MKNLFFLLIIVLSACTAPKSKNEIAAEQIAWYHSIMKENAYSDSLIEEEMTEEEQSDFSCEIQYDTITDKKYTFHKSILDILNNKSSHSLDDQMVSRFILSLNPDENNFYKILTNKVIYALLEKQPAKLSNYNPKSLPIELYNYFLYQIENPKCNTLSLKEIVKKVRKEFPSGEVDGPKKSKILYTLTNACNDCFSSYSAPSSIESKFKVEIIVKIPGDSLGATISITRDDKLFQTIKSDGLFYSVDFNFNSKYLITCSKKGYSTKIVTLDTNIPKGREVDEFAKFTMDIGLLKKSKDNKRDTSVPVGGVSYIEEEEDFNVVKE